MRRMCARRDLAAWLASHKLSHADFAALISVSTSAVDRWLSDDPATRRWPSTDAIFLIEDATKGQIAARSWRRRPSRRRSPPTSTS